MASGRSRGQSAPDPGEALRSFLAVVPAMVPAARHGFHAQDRVLRDMEQFTQHGVDRRHEALRSAAELAGRLSNGELADPAAAAQAIGAWQQDSAQRIAHDLREGSEVAMRCASHLGRGGAEVGEEALSNAARNAVPDKRKPRG